MPRLDVRVVEVSGLKRPRDLCVKLRVEKTLVESSTVRSSVRPRYDEVFRFLVKDTASATLRIKVVEKGVLSDTVLGTHEVSIASLYQGEVLDEHVPLKGASGKVKAELHVRIAAMDFGLLRNGRNGSQHSRTQSATSAATTPTRGDAAATIAGAATPPRTSPNATQQSPPPARKAYPAVGPAHAYPPHGYPARHAYPPHAAHPASAHAYPPHAYPPQDTSMHPVNYRPVVTSPTPDSSTASRPPGTYPTRPQPFTIVPAGPYAPPQGNGTYPSSPFPARGTTAYPASSPAAAVATDSPPSHSAYPPVSVPLSSLPDSLSQPFTMPGATPTYPMASQAPQHARAPQPPPPAVWERLGLGQVEYDHLVAVFLGFDDAHVGTLSREDLGGLVRWLNYATSEAAIDRMFADMTGNAKKERVTQDEFCTWLAAHRPDPQALYGLTPLEYDEVLVQFHMCDTDRSGRIQRHDFVRFCCDNQWCLSAAEADALFDAIDSARFGVLSLHEFLQFRSSPRGRHLSAAVPLKLLDLPQTSLDHSYTNLLRPPTDGNTTAGSIAPNSPTAAKKDVFIHKLRDVAPALSDIEAANLLRRSGWDLQLAADSVFG
jgi:Ca2+-binding EF-hand superfamily protein